MLVDAAIVMESLAVAFLFRFGFVESFQSEFWFRFWPLALIGALLFVLLLALNGVYQSILRYTGIYQGVKIASATAIATGLLFIFNVAMEEILGSYLSARSVVLMGAVLAYVQLVAVRLYPRVFYELSLREVGRRKRTTIVGTGREGAALAGHIWRTAAAEAQVVGFISDTSEDVGKHIEGVTVVGIMDEIETIIAEHGVDQVIIAAPQASREQVDNIWRACVRSSVEVKVMPDLGEFLTEGAIRLRELQIEDLLGREPVNIDFDTVSSYINGKRVLVTGAGGSIGKELARQISWLGPARLILLDRDESALYYLGEELSREGLGGAMDLVIGDVSVTERVESVFESLGPHIVFHAAAYKHVPIMESQASEAILNNVGGTLNIARTAGSYEVEKFINVSTDKAVKPANVMGATKRLSELLVRNTAYDYPETAYASVRFGNVLDSRGSVVPTFRRQIEAGGPVTVTHPEIMRYFMTIPEAVSLILRAGIMADDHGSYILDMGRPVRILDLARNMIEIMGASGVEIKFVGLRPGEKLNEELIEEGEQRLPTDHPMVYEIVSESIAAPNNLSTLVEDMIRQARHQETEKASKLLKQAVPNYTAPPIGEFNSDDYPRG